MALEYDRHNSLKTAIKTFVIPSSSIDYLKVF